MRRHTTIDLDEDLLREAAAVLGTRRTTDTLHAALADVIARDRRTRLARLDFPDLTPAGLETMRSPRLFDSADGRDERDRADRPDRRRRAPKNRDR